MIHLVQFSSISFISQEQVNSNVGYIIQFTCTTTAYSMYVFEMYSFATTP